MSNTPFLVALGICISLSSAVAVADTASTSQVNAENSTASQDSGTQGSAYQNKNPQAPENNPTSDSTLSSTASNENNSPVSNDTTTDGSSESKPTLIQRSVNSIGEIGSRSIEQVSALGSKIAVNANASQPDSVKDPFENFNRKIFNFNMKIDKYVLLPVARTYKKVVPTPVRHGVTNFFVNLSMPWTAVNNMLQGHPGTSVESLSRFVINTTTSLGFYDTATYLGIDRSDEDFGLTLGKWGVGSGPYVMLPLLGPSTVRDTFSRAVDQFGAPQSYLNNTWEVVGITGVKVIDLRSRLIGFETFVQGDQYTLLRDLYLQKRQFQNGPPSTAPDANSSTDSFSNDGFGDNGFGDGDFKSQNATEPNTTSDQMSKTASSITPTKQNVDASSTEATPGF
jgi:phospholipid-binding lipoprotein MlaA